MKFLWVNLAPFDTPVVPPVYYNAAILLFVNATFSLSNFISLPSLSTSVNYKVSLRPWEGTFFLKASSVSFGSLTKSGT